MKSHQIKMNELDSKFKMTIKSQLDRDLIVQAPLPDDFGFTVGNVYSTPFDTGGLSETMQKALALTSKATDTSAFSGKLGITMDKVFTNPEPTEISFDLEFTAFYDAKK